MANYSEMASIDDQIPRIPQTEKHEIEEGSKVDHLIVTNGQDPSGSQTNKSINEIFDEKFKNLNNSSIKSCTIFKVNVWLRESNPDAYTPKMVSIGPYHNKKPQLHPMEKYKLLYLQRFLGRKEGLDVESCIKELEGLKEEALTFYDDVETYEFCQMLLLDGCFVVEFIREYFEIGPKEDKIINDNIVGYIVREEDKIINDNIVGFIVRDLLLLENQLPFFVLDKLHGMTKQDDELALRILGSFISLPFFVKFSEKTIGNFLEITGGNIKHLLHLKHAILCHGNVTSNATELSESFIEAGEYYNIKNILHLVCRYLGHAGNGKDNDDQMWQMVMQNATELSEAGVTFEKAGVSFDSTKFENGLMKIPRFRVTDDTETLLRNLIAYEQQSVNMQPKYFSDFAVFMDNLIESDKDVNLLCHKGIIENWLGDDKEVANLFNKIGNGVSTGHNFYYKEACRKAVKHCEKPWNKMKANLLRNYFSSPWVGASTVAAILLLILTFIQTILAFVDSV